MKESDFILDKVDGGGYDYRERLFLLTGCGNFGEPDKDVSDCVWCFEEFKTRYLRCRLFRNMIESYRKEKEKWEVGHEVPPESLLYRM